MLQKLRSACLAVNICSDENFGLLREHGLVDTIFNLSMSHRQLLELNVHMLLSIRMKKVSSLPYFIGLVIKIF